MKKIILFLLAIFIIHCSKANNTPPMPKAVKGTLDLQSWNFEKDGPVNLDGEWEFYWKEFLPPSDFAIQNSKLKTPNYITVPNVWNNHIYDAAANFIQYMLDCLPAGVKHSLKSVFSTFFWNFIYGAKIITGQGYATYRLRVLLPPVETMAIKILDQRTAYRIYINGELLSEVGKVGKSKEESKGMYLAKIISLPTTATSISPTGVRFIDIVFHVSNYDHAFGGLINKIALGKTNEFLKEREKNIALDLLVSGALLIMGLYHLSLFALRRKDKSPLYFGLFCLLICLRPILSGEFFILTILPDFPWALNLKMSYLTVYGTPSLFILYLSSLFPIEVPKRIKKTTFISSAILFSIVLFFPPIVFTYTLQVMHIIIVVIILISIYVMILGSIRKREGSTILFVGTLVFALIIVNDMLYVNAFIHTGQFSPLAFLVFIFSHSFVLSSRFSKAFNQVEVFSEELENLNKNLEGKVKERTYHLEQAKAEIEKIAESRKRLSIVGQKVAGIVHDLKNPISTIKSFAEMANTDTISRDEREEFLTTIAREIDRLGNLAYDILDFSKNEITLELSQVNLTEFLKGLHQFLKMDFDYANIALNIKTNYTGTVVMDRERMRRVLINMANNAREAMQEIGKNYFFSIEVFEENDSIFFTLTDNGKGLSASIKEQIFDAFVTEGKAKGTGLGLYMCKIIVDAHGGELSYTTELEKGTTFIIKLPIKEKT
jgi:signal transduction histidine kinase